MNGKIRNVLQWSAFVICLGAVLTALPLAVSADGGAPEDEDSFTIYAYTQGETAFKVEKSYGENPVYVKKHKNQKADFAYTLTLMVEDPGAERTAAVYTKTAAVPAGKDSAVIDVSRYIQELQRQMKMSGSVSIALETPEGANYGAGGSTALSVYNSAYQQDIAADADGYAKFAEDYQQFIMSHPGMGVTEINRAFLKQYPQYRKQMPQVE